MCFASWYFSNKKYMHWVLVFFWWKQHPIPNFHNSCGVIVSWDKHIVVDVISYSWVHTARGMLVEDVRTCHFIWGRQFKLADVWYWTAQTTVWNEETFWLIIYLSQNNPSALGLDLFHHVLTCGERKRLCDFMYKFFQCHFLKYLRKAGSASSYSSTHLDRKPQKLN